MTLPAETPPPSPHKMDRFELLRFQPSEFESLLAEQPGTRLYDGDVKTNLPGGHLLLTTHRLFWGKRADILAGESALCLWLSGVRSLDVATSTSLFSGTRSKLVVHLLPVTAEAARRPHPHRSTANFVKFSTEDGQFPDQFTACVRNTLAARVWEADTVTQPPPAAQAGGRPTAKPLRTGIGGIERDLLERQQNTGDTINVAFQDLNKLMASAKDMVAVSQAFSAKVVQRQGEISADETVRLRAQLLGLGIDNPVVRDQLGDASDFHALLAQEIGSLLLQPLQAAGGLMTLPEAYCRVNRARAMELLSPDDVLKACQRLGGDGSGSLVRLRTFDSSGTMVLQLATHDDAVVAAEVLELVRREQSLSIEQLARVQGISVMLAQVRLLATEQLALVCRDESMEGLRFYPNRFVEQ